MWGFNIRKLQIYAATAIKVYNLIGAHPHKDNLYLFPAVGVYYFTQWGLMRLCWFHQVEYLGSNAREFLKSTFVSRYPQTHRCVCVIHLWSCEKTWMMCISV